MAGLPASSSIDWPRPLRTVAWGASDISTARTSAESPPARCWGRSGTRGAPAGATGAWGLTFCRARFLDLRAIARLSLPTRGGQEIGANRQAMGEPVLGRGL